MKLHGRIPVEPLDEERLTNIERRLVIGVSELGPRPVRAPRRYLALSGIALAVVVAGFVGFRLHPAPVVAPAADPPAVAVHTDAERSTVDIGDATITSDPATAFEVTRPSGGVLVAMQHGKVELEVQKRHGRPPLVVRAGDTDVEVVGTHFSVAWDGHGAVDVRVTEGTVRVKHQQQETLVAHGSSWTTTGGLVASIPATAPEPARGSDAPLAISLGDAPEILHARHAAVPTTTTPRAPVRAVARTFEIDHEARQRAIAQADPYVELKVAIRRQPIAFAPAIEDKTEATARIAELKKIAYSPNMLGPDAAAALYRIAVLLDQPLGQSDEALRTLEMYRRRFSAGKEFSAALWLRVRILCGRTIDDACRKAAYTYQHEVPSGEAADIAIRITNSQ